jgi:hypothetical protein
LGLALGPAASSVPADADGDVGGVVVVPEDVVGLLVGVDVSDGVGDAVGDGELLGVGEAVGGPAVALGGAVVQLPDGDGLGLVDWFWLLDGVVVGAVVGTDEPALGLPVTCRPLPAGWPPPPPLWVCKAVPVLLEPPAVRTLVLPVVSASAPVPTISTNAAIAATGRSQR